MSIQQVGAVVEVKNQDGVYQEATINKLTDASMYTVGKSTINCPLTLLSLTLYSELVNNRIPYTDDSSEFSRVFFFASTLCLKK